MLTCVLSSPVFCILHIFDCFLPLFSQPPHIVLPCVLEPPVPFLPPLVVLTCILPPLVPLLLPLVVLTCVLVPLVFCVQWLIVPCWLIAHVLSPPVPLMPPLIVLTCILSPPVPLSPLLAVLNGILPPQCFASSVSLIVFFLSSLTISMSYSLIISLLCVMQFSRISMRIYYIIICECLPYLELCDALGSA